MNAGSPGEGLSGIVNSRLGLLGEGALGMGHSVMGCSEDRMLRDGVLRDGDAQRMGYSGMGMLRGWGCSGMRYSEDEVLRGNGLGTEQSRDAGAGLMMVQAMSPRCSCLLILKQHVGPHLDHS